MIVSIYPMFGDGKIREIKAETDLLPENSIHTPDGFSGRLCDLPSIPDFFAMRDREVLFEGRRYKFAELQKDGSFTMHKDW